MQDGKAHLVIKKADNGHEYVHVVCLCPVMAEKMTAALNKREEMSRSPLFYFTRSYPLEQAEMVRRAGVEPALS